MKKVVRKQQQAFLEDVNPAKYYGIQDNNKYKGLIHKNEYTKGNYKAYCRTLITNGNGFLIKCKDPPVTDDLQVFIGAFLDSGSYTVYEFDTPQELFKWLAE